LLNSAVKVTAAERSYMDVDRARLLHKPRYAAREQGDVSFLRLTTNS